VKIYQYKVKRGVGGGGRLEDDMRPAFSQLGMVRSARIMKDEIGNSKVRRQRGMWDRDVDDDLLPAEEE
jgi:hypothetical protein